ncbi:hypothetical protein D3C84_708960 [compost metagenome]
MSDAGNTKRCLAAQCLRIETTFTGDHQIGTHHRLGQTHQLRHHFNPCHELRPEKRLGGKPKAARRTAARFVAYVLCQGVCAVIGKVPEGSVQLFDLCRRCAFLRAKNGGGSVRTAEWIVHVRCNVEAHFGQTRIDAGQINAGQLRQRQTTGLQLLALCIEQPHAQGLHGTRTAVVGGAATDGQDHPLRTRIQCRTNQLAGAEGAADAGIAAVEGHQLQTTGLGHFDDRGVVLG